MAQIVIALGRPMASPSAVTACPLASVCVTVLPFVHSRPIFSATPATISCAPGMRGRKPLARVMTWTGLSGKYDLMSKAISLPRHEGRREKA